MQFQNPDGSAFTESGGTPLLVVQPTSGSTIALQWNQRSVYVANTGTLAALTIQLPMKVENGEVIEIAAAKTITALTIVDGAGNAITGVAVAPLELGNRRALRYAKSNYLGVAAWVPWDVSGGQVDVPLAYNTNTATSAVTLTGANVTGGSAETVLALTGTLGADANATLPTVAGMVAALPDAAAGQTFKLRVINESSANHVWTVITNTGWTLTGTMTVAQNTWRDFVVTLTSLAAATLQSVGTGTYS